MNRQLTSGTEPLVVVDKRGPLLDGRRVLFATDGRNFVVDLADYGGDPTSITDTSGVDRRLVAVDRDT